MDGARQDSKMLVIVPGADESHIAVNIEKDAVKSSEAFRDAVAQGKQVFLTYDTEFASEGLHIWCTNEVVRDGSPQWVDTDWKVYTSVDKGGNRIEDGVRRLQIGDGGGSAESGHDEEDAKVRRLH